MYYAGKRADQMLYEQHDAQWIQDGCPGAGNITIFNNGYDRGWSSVEEIVPPVDANGRYVLEPGKAYGPDKPVWHYEAKNRTDFFSSEISGAQRLPNGNTLMSNWLGHGNLGKSPHLIEITPDKKVVWTFADHQTMRTISSVLRLDVPGDPIRGEIWH